MAVLILLFGQLIDMPADAETILEDANCIDQFIPDGSKLAVLISLACQLVQGGTLIEGIGSSPDGFVVGVTEPDVWFTVSKNGVTYRVPGYAS